MNSIKYLLPSNDSLFKAPYNRLNSYIFFINSSYTYLFALYVRFSVTFYSSQFIDAFAYEVPKLGKIFSKEAIVRLIKNLKLKRNQSVYVTHFFLPFINIHFFIFSNTNPNINNYGNLSSTSGNKLLTIEDIFLNASWAEREALEMSGLYFFGKNDTRNLLMCYGDFFYPMFKMFPPIGLYELFYNLIIDALYRCYVGGQL